jgi:UPF0755 protein
MKLSKFRWVSVYSAWSLFIASTVMVLALAPFYHFTQVTIAQKDLKADVLIESGSTVRDIASRLHQAGVLDHPDYFVWWLRWQNLGSTLKAGEYRISSQIKIDDLVRQLQSGKSIQYPFTLHAGKTMQQFLQQLQTLDHIEITQDWMSESGREALHQLLDRPLSQDARYPYANVEGLLLPETYFYQRGIKDTTLILRAAESLQSLLEAQWQARQSKLPLQSAYQGLILASIIERETGLAHERAKVAGVFVNRLNRKMRLQTDPTVIYGMGANYDGNIRRRDLRETTPYNTYRIKSLPPTPIAFASEEAIIAAFNPAKTDALYFVASGRGGHVFSKTLKEHNRAVRDFLRRTKD